MIAKPKEKKCHDCDAAPGELHSLNCDVERCPFCGGQLLSCNCMYEMLGPMYGWDYKPEIVLPAVSRHDVLLSLERLNEGVPEGYGLNAVFPDGRRLYTVPFNGLPEEIYNEGPTEEMMEKWEAILEVEGRIPWTGRWPGEEECEEYDFWCYTDPTFYGDPESHYGHIPCDKDHPEATHNLNRLHSDCVWSRKRKKWVLADSDEGRAIVAEREAK